MDWGVLRRGTLVELEILLNAMVEVTNGDGVMLSALATALAHGAEWHSDVRAEGSAG